MAGAQRRGPLWYYDVITRVTRPAARPPPQTTAAGTSESVRPSVGERIIHRNMTDEDCLRRSENVIRDVGIINPSRPAHSGTPYFNCRELKLYSKRLCSF